MAAGAIEAASFTDPLPVRQPGESRRPDDVVAMIPGLSARGRSVAEQLYVLRQHIQFVRTQGRTGCCCGGN